MFHIILLDIRKKEFWNIIDGYKTMLCYASNADKPKYNRLKVADEVFFLENSGKGVVKAKAIISNIIKLQDETEEEKEQILKYNIDSLCISKTEFRHLLNKPKIYLIEIKDVVLCSPMIYVNASKLRDLASFNEMDEDLLKMVK